VPTWTTTSGARVRLTGPRSCPPPRASSLPWSPTTASSSLAHLEFSGGKDYDPFTVDILTTTGRVPQIDPLPCPVQRAAEAEELSCFAWTEDEAATWTLASGDRPGVLWIIGAQDDDRFNRVESVGLRIESRGIVNPFFAEAGTPENRLPEDWFGYVYPLTGDLSVGPETSSRSDMGSDHPCS
jgi:hypothetical protein